MNATHPRLVTGLVYAALSTSVVSSLGMLLVPSISEGMGVSASTAQWMLTINLLAGAIATPVMGRLSDGPHKKRLLLISLVLILVGSVLAAAAPNFPVFLVGRALQGLTYGIVPVTIALARRYVAADRVQSSISTLSVTVASGLGIGYPLTGIIAGALDYRYAFWFAALFVVTAIIVVVRIVPDGPDDRATQHRFDLPGAALLGLGLGALLLGISEGGRWGWASPPTLIALAVAVVALGSWATVELRSDHPLVNLRVLRAGDVLLANGAAIGLGAAVYIGLSVASIVAQAPDETGYGLAMPVYWAGFVMLPLSIGSFVSNRVVRSVSRRVPMTTLLPVGAILMAVAGTWMWLAHTELIEICIGMLLFGLGMGASYAAMPALIARRVAVQELGSSVSFNQVLRTVGSSFGTAVSAAVMAAHTAQASTHPDASGITATFEIGAIACLVVAAMLLTHALLTRRGSKTDHSAIAVTVGE